MHISCDKANTQNSAYKNKSVTKEKLIINRRSRQKSSTDGAITYVTQAKN
jgi:hypothetical protein